MNFIERKERNETERKGVTEAWTPGLTTRSKGIATRSKDVPSDWPLLITLWANRDCLTFTVSDGCTSSKALLPSVTKMQKTTQEQRVPTFF